MEWQPYISPYGMCTYLGTCTYIYEQSRLDKYLRLIYCKDTEPLYHSFMGILLCTHVVVVVVVVVVYSQQS